MSDVSYHDVDSDDAGQRLDNYLMRQLKGVPKSLIYRIIRSGEVRVNKKRAKPSYKIEAEDRIRIPPVRTSPPSQSTKPTPKRDKSLNDRILFENNLFLVINKPAGLAVHGGSGIQYGLIESIRNIRQDLHYIELVHRLDRDTSGCIVLAKKRSVLRKLQALIRDRVVEKRYIALLHGRWYGAQCLDIKKALRKNVLSSGERMVFVDPEGKPSHTTFTLKQNFRDGCLVEAILHTGRTHQIRVHSQAIGHAIIGDEKYHQKTGESCDSIKAKRLYLHANEISFTLDDETYHFKAPVDALFQQTVNQMGSKD